MRIGSLFSGAGLGDLGWMMAGFDIQWQIEIDPYCRKILDLRYPETMKLWDINNLTYGLKEGIIESWNGNAHNVKLDKKQKEDHIASRVTHREFWNGATSIETITEKLKETGVGRRKRKLSIITAENASVAEKSVLSSLLSTIRMEKEMKSGENINHKHGKLSEKTNSQKNTESFVTTVTTQSTISEYAPIKIEKVDVITAGVPCQPASNAGNRKGREDNRWLWPATIKVIQYLKPTWVIFENVSGLISLEQGMALESILSQMEAIGYEIETIIFPAHSLGANHKRDRIWIVGNSEHNGQLTSEKRESIETRNGSCEERKIKTSESEGPGKQFPKLANTTDTRSEGMYKRKKSAFEYWWSSEPRICRVDDGCPDRVDRLKALGNGQVVACTAFIGQQIMEFEKMKGKL